jgi:type IV secretory pathway protease TraF
MIGRNAALAITLLGGRAVALPQLEGRPLWLVWNASASVPIGLYASP